MNSKWTNNFQIKNDLKIYFKFFFVNVVNRDKMKHSVKMKKRYVQSKRKGMSFILQKKKRKAKRFGRNLCRNCLLIATYVIGTGSFLGVKRPGCDVGHPTPN